MTEAESLVWSKIRRRQIDGIQFYRQRVISTFIVDFYAPTVKLVLEIDGSQHLEVEYLEQDKCRDAFLNNLGIMVLRFDNHQVMFQLGSVIDRIYDVIEDFGREKCHFRRS
ncbi:endonuclease domain-containing protein [Candidatus Berkiella aquae]|nr:endonuclease domain-containing protein [Candidatus Berkiella aquae]